MKWLLVLGALLALPAAAQTYDNSSGAQKVVPCAPGGSKTACSTPSVTTKAASTTWIAPTSGTVTSSGTVVAAGPTVSIITNTTASGGGTLTLNLFGGTAVDNVGIPLVPGQAVSIYGQPTGAAITGKCSTGTCAFGAQSGS